MKHTKQEIEKLLVFADDDDEFLFEEWKDTKKQRTLLQNKTFHLILWAISKHLWYTMEEVKAYMLSWCFWAQKIRLSKEEMDIPIISSTTQLSKEQAIFFIDTLLQFAKIKDVPIEITPRGIQSLYESYNN